ncbi:hypothetical protein [Streptomyces violaceorubidus]|uniref:Uncharacterized protein n=1 Tax=Streptomyces violaceorubidus TaxID=284042 RepID=A0ABV1SUN7_9ACTN
MSRTTSRPEADAVTAGIVDDLVITEFGHEPDALPDSRICICWTPGSGTGSPADGGSRS